MTCTRGNHSRIVTYKIFINKQLIYANVTIRLALFIYRPINIPVHRLSSSCAKLASDVGIAVLAISTAYFTTIVSHVLQILQETKKTV